MRGCRRLVVKGDRGKLSIYFLRIIRSGQDFERTTWCGLWYKYTLHIFWFGEGVFNTVCGSLLPRRGRSDLYLELPIDRFLSLRYHYPIAVTEASSSSDSPS